MEKEKTILPDKNLGNNPPKKDDFPINRFDYTKTTLESIDEIRKLIVSGEAVCKLKTLKNGRKKLTVYKTSTQDVIFYTEAPWQIGQIIEDIEVFEE